KPEVAPGPAVAALPTEEPKPGLPEALSNPQKAGRGHHQKGEPESLAKNLGGGRGHVRMGDEESGRGSNGSNEPSEDKGISARGSGTRGRGADDLDSLMNKVLGGASAPKTPARAAAASAESGLPDMPPREGVRDALQSVRAAVSTCGQ